MTGSGSMNAVEDISVEGHIDEKHVPIQAHIVVKMLYLTDNQLQVRQNEEMKSKCNSHEKCADQYSGIIPSA